MTPATPVRTLRRTPGQVLDSWASGPRSALGRTAAWAAVNYGVLLLATVTGYLLMALPPLSLLPSAEPLVLADHVLGALLYGGIGWPLHLAVIAWVSRSQQARLWVVLTTPLMSFVTFGLIYVVAAAGSATAQAVVLTFTLYGVACRLYPSRRRTEPTA